MGPTDRWAYKGCHRDAQNASKKHFVIIHVELCLTYETLHYPWIPSFKPEAFRQNYVTCKEERLVKQVYIV